jgi:hypothetical protein
MDMPEGTAFGYYTVPLASGITAQKPQSVKTTLTDAGMGA